MSHMILSHWTDHLILQIAKYFPILTGFHDQEEKFYTHIAPLYRLPLFPRVFASQKSLTNLNETFLLMEEVADGVHADVYEGLTHGQVRKNSLQLPPML